MKKTRVLLVLSIGLFSSAIVLLSIAWFSQKKIAFIDSQILLSDYQGMVDARSAYAIKEQQWKTNIDSLTYEVREAISDYEKSAATLTEKERELSEQLIRSKQQQLQQYQQAISSQAQQEDQAMTQRVLDQVNAYLEEYGKKHGYEIILVATQMGNIAYADERQGLTALDIDGTEVYIGIEVK